MCEIPECAASCKHAARMGAAAGVLLGCALAWEVGSRLLGALLPVVAALAVAVVVAAAGLVAAFLVLGALRVRRGRRVLSARVVAHAGVTAAAIPAVGVPLALAAGAPLLTGPATVAGLVVLLRFAWSVIVKPSVAMRLPGAYQRALAAPPRRRAVPAPARVLEGTVISPGGE